MKPIARPRVLLAGTLLGLALIALPGRVGRADGAGAAGKAPHVLIILADDLGWLDLGCHGSPDLTTPHLDRLAREGVRFLDAHVTASVCAPSRTGFTLGRYQQREGCEGNGRAGQGLPMKDIRTFPLEMQAAGYQTVCIGKWHMGLEAGRRPGAQGYEHFSGFLGGSRSYRALEKPNPHQALWRDGRPVDEKEVGYLTDWLSEEACRHIRDRDRKRPLMMVLNYNAPHTPMHAREDDLERFADIPRKRRRTYAAMVWRMDVGIGRVLAALRKEGMEKNSLVVFFSDNGGATNNGSDNGPWRGMKGSKWEGGHRVPFLVRWPARLRPGTYAPTISTLDLMPTCLAAAGRTVPAWADGVDLLPRLAGEGADDPHEHLFWRRMVVAAVREGDLKLIRVEHEEGGGHDWRLVDIARDPAEVRDLSGTQPEDLARLQARLSEWEKGNRRPLWREGKRWERNQRFKHRMDTLGRAKERKYP